MMDQGLIHITVNGETRELPQGSTLAQLIESLQLQGKRFAVERNNEIVPKSTLAEVILQDADKLEIVQAIGGG